MVVEQRLVASGLKLDNNQLTTLEGITEVVLSSNTLLAKPIKFCPIAGAPTTMHPYVNDKLTFVGLVVRVKTRDTISLMHRCQGANKWIASALQWP